MQAKTEAPRRSFGRNDSSTRAVFGETTNTDSEVSISILKHLKLNIKMYCNLILTAISDEDFRSVEEFARHVAEDVISPWQLDAL